MSEPTIMERLEKLRDDIGEGWSFASSHWVDAGFIFEMERLRNELNEIIKDLDKITEVSGESEHKGVINE